jgi:hypothetical protein
MKQVYMDEYKPASDIVAVQFISISDFRTDTWRKSEMMINYAA